jgi:FixJ family two-component response regulator
LSTKYLIAIVDDDESMRQALTALVRSLGYGAIAFAGAEQLLESSRRDDISCLISDMQMPGMSGLELYGRLAADKKSIPTILITAYPDERTQRRAHEAGVNGYLTKPFHEDDLIACLHSALGQHC